MAVHPPKPRMPPLGALRAFEAAARTGSFASAASELNVTPAAVAQQVKTLEAWLGCPLFHRAPQGVRLTDRGRIALPSLVHAFDALGQSVRALNAAARPGHIEIAALPAIATLWLAPRLGAMRAAFPDVIPSITALETAPNLDRDPYDLALFPVRAGGVAICADRITPVCSPAIAPLGDPVPWLARQRLLHDTAWHGDWPLWLQAAGISLTGGQAVQRFSLYSLAVQAAIDGAGVLIGHTALVDAHLREGTLVAPFALTASTGWNFAVMVPDHPTPLVQGLARWLVGRG